MPLKGIRQKVGGENEAALSEENSQRDYLEVCPTEIHQKYFQVGLQYQTVEEYSKGTRERMQMLYIHNIKNPTT